MTKLPDWWIRSEKKWLVPGYGDRIYMTWYDMKRRCYNENDKSYFNYGLRGIIVCDEWRNNFNSFYDWATKNGYTDELFIDRIDNDGNYCPENCRWVSQKQQQNNKRNNRLLESNGKTQTLSQWANELNIKYAVLANRLKSGWSVEKILTQPVKSYRKRLVRRS